MYLHISTIVSFIVFYKHTAYSTYPFDLIQTKCKILRDWYSYLRNDVLVMEQSDTCKAHGHTVFIASFNDLVISDRTARLSHIFHAALMGHFWAGETSADVGWSLGMYMSGFFPCMMFGILGAALAMIKTAKNKKAAIGLVLSAAICAFVCGVTEPFEFGFMFLCFPLYVVYSALYGIFTIITYYSGFRAGFCFSAGATDLVFSASLPAAAKTWMIIPLGIAAFVVFYFVFYFAITKFDLKTPGREDEDAEEAEKKVVLANNNYTEVAAGVLKAIGGKENVSSVDYCATRLRFTIKDYTAVDEKAVKAAGAAGVIRPDKTTCQVIIGTKVQFVYDELKKML